MNALDQFAPMNAALSLPDTLPAPPMPAAIPTTVEVRVCQAIDPRTNAKCGSLTWDEDDRTPPGWEHCTECHDHHTFRFEERPTFAAPIVALAEALEAAIVNRHDPDCGDWAVTDRADELALAVMGWVYEPNGYRDGVGDFDAIIANSHDIASRWASAILGRTVLVPW